jgi:peptidoglycan/LPS O-acetylase OafA/YrhL
VETATLATPVDAPAPARTAAAAPAPAGGSRLGWLDVLRGLAALAVVYHHAGFYVLTGAHRNSDRWLAAGVFGTTLFFLISGYIIPASLERKGSLRGFWISRVFRLYPLWIVAIGAVALLDRTDHYAVTADDAYLHQHPGSVLLSHATMLQDLLNVPAPIGAMWSLSYEMVFYCLISGLFVLRTHRASPRIALLIVAAGAVLVPTLPYATLSRHLGTLPVAGVAAAVFGAGLLAATSGVRPVATVGALSLAGLAVVLLYGNRGYPWDGLLIPAYMFVGTTIYRAQTGQLRARTAAAVALVVLGVVAVSDALHAGRLHTDADGRLVEQRHWIGAVLAAAACFGVGLLLRHRPMPGLLRRLGEISYSVYLLHLVLLSLLTRQLTRFGVDAGRDGTPMWQQVAALVGVVIVVCLCAEATFRLVERPAQRVGHRLAGWAQRRFGSDAGLFDPPERGSRGRRRRAVHS